MNMLASVIGATGQTGKHIVKKLIKKNIPVRVLSRNLTKAKKMSGNSVEIIEGDLVEVKDLNDLLNSGTHLFAAHGADNGSNPRGYKLIDFGGMKEVLRRHSRRTGYQHHLYVFNLFRKKNPPPDYSGRTYIGNVRRNS